MVFEFTGNGIIEFLHSNQSTNALLVAGGTAGGLKQQGAYKGAGGGGGAGVLGVGILNVAEGTSYAVTIGPGGTEGHMFGQESTIVGGSIAETAVGGGRGGSVGASLAGSRGSIGGSGGESASEYQNSPLGGSASPGMGSLTYMGNAGRKGTYGGGGGSRRRGY